MKVDYYEMLGVTKGCDEKTLKSAFRKLAMQFHPDKNPGDAAAEAKFKELGEAYEVLKDPQKRSAYDRYGHAAFQNGGQGGGFRGDFGSSMADVFDDIFGEMMGQRRGRAAGGGGGVVGARGPPRRPRGVGRGGRHERRDALRRDVGHAARGRVAY